MFAVVLKCMGSKIDAQKKYSVMSESIDVTIGSSMVVALTIYSERACSMYVASAVPQRAGHTPAGTL